MEVLVDVPLDGDQEVEGLPRVSWDESQHHGEGNEEQQYGEAEALTELVEEGSTSNIGQAEDSIDSNC